MKDVRFSPDDIVVDVNNTTRPRSGKEKTGVEGKQTSFNNNEHILTARTQSRAESRPISRLSPRHSERPLSRVTNGRTSSMHQYERSPTVISDRIYDGYTRATSRASTVKSALSQRGHVMSSSNGRSARTTCSSILMEPAFMDITKHVPRFTIFRVENKTRVWPLAEEEHGFFHEGAAYIVMRIDSDEVTTLHYWIGSGCSLDESKIVEEKAHELDRILNFTEVFSRETQNYESSNFLRLFPDGIIYIEGKPRTSVGRSANYAKRLYIVAGRKFVRAKCVEPVVQSLDSNSAAILDGFPRIYVWIGHQCPYTLRIKTLNIAKNIRNAQRKGVAHIVVIEEIDETMDSSFRKKLQAKAQPSNGCDVNEFETTTKSCKNMVLHRVSGDKVMYDMPEASRCPLRHRYLVNRDSYLLDRGPTETLYIWVGSQSYETNVQNAIKRGKAFRDHLGYPAHLSICRISEDHEPTEFRKNFYDWREKEIRHRKLTKKFSIGNIERVLFSTKDNRTVAKLDELWSMDMFADGETDTKIWSVDEETINELSWDECGVFSNGKCYMLQHTIRNNQETVKVLYYWLGSKADECLHEKTKRTVLEMNKLQSNDSVLVRILDGKEPEHFMLTLQNSIIIYDKDAQQQNNQTQMFSVREFPNGCMRVQQVEVSSSNLNSSASFIILTETECYLWYGQASGSPEREYAKSVLSYLCPKKMYEFDIVTEGKECEIFWNLIGSRLQYEEEYLIEKLDRRPARLSRMVVVDDDDVRFLDVDNFRQEDLSDEDILILDVYDTIYMWTGHNVPDIIRSQQYKIIESYVKSDPAGRHLEDINIWMTSQWFESDVFRKCFRTWQKDGYYGKRHYEVMRKSIRQENAVTDIEQQIVERSYVHCTKYEYQELLKCEDLPLDVNNEHREFHLKESNFKKVLKQSRAEFYRNPQWKQNQILRSARLSRIPTPQSMLKLYEAET